MRASLIDLCILNLMGILDPSDRGYAPTEYVVKLLVERSGVDFGADGGAWLEWYKKNHPEELFFEYPGDPPRLRLDE